MRASEWKRASHSLEKALPGFEPMKFGYVSTIRNRWIAECIFADSSAFSAARFHLEAFVLPLFIPTTHLYFSYGFRIGTYWEDVSTTLIRAVVDSVPRLHEMTDLRRLIEAAVNWKINAHHLELRIAGAVILDDHQLMSESRLVLSDWKCTVAWEEEVVRRCNDLLGVIDEAGVQSAIFELERRRGKVLGILARDRCGS